MGYLTLDQFRAALGTGGFASVGVLAAGDRFFVTGVPRDGDTVTLATTRGGKPRGFRDVGKALALLHGMGASHVSVDMTGWSPTLADANGRRRPDAAERQKRAHQAAAHDSWFRGEVQRAIEEAESPDAKWLSTEAVEALLDERRAVWRAKAAAGA